MREYETVYLLKPDLPSDQLSTLKEKFTQTITKGEGHMLSQGDWGKRKLAYDLKKNRYGHYIYLQYLSTGPIVSNLERLLKLDDSVLKFLTVKLADKVDVEERLKNLGEAPLAPEEPAPSRAQESPQYRRGDRGDRGDRPYRDRDRDRGEGDHRSSPRPSAERSPSESKPKEKEASKEASKEVPKEAPTEAPKETPKEEA